MNQTEVRTFKAASMQAALEIVRREMGPQAVILQTRELPEPLFFRWRGSTDRVEVTAGTGVNVPTPRSLLPSAAPSSARSMADDADPRAAEAAAAEAWLSGREPGSESARRSSQARSAVETNPPRAGQYRNHAADGTHSGNVGAPPGEQQSAIAKQLSSIQQMVTQLSRDALSRGEEIPTELFQLYTDLIDAEVAEDLARDLTRRIKQTCAPAELADPSTVKGRLRTMVEADVRCTAPITTTPGKRRVVALIGPTGVGKTTTIAKLAANFRLRDGIRMGLVTVDTYRIAAVEQLRTYAEIIDLPMKVVTSPREMRRALDELQGLDLVLIDTAGRSPRDELKIQELKSLLTEAQVDETHLVLSLVASARSLQSTAERFAPAGPTALVLTKLDEAVGMGSLLSVSRQVPLPISYLTTGQDVPDDIEHAQPRRISRLVLGEENLFARRRHAA